MRRNSGSKRWVLSGLAAGVSVTVSLSAPLRAQTAFGSGKDYPTGLGDDFALAANLFNSGRPDVCILNSVAGTVSIFRNTGGGAFASSVDYYAGSAPQAAVAADLNGTGSLDLAVACRGSNAISVLFNTGLGTFLPGLTFPAGSAPTAVAVADLNGDGKNDIVAANESSGTISVLLNLGAGLFGFATPYPTSSNPHSIALADFNGDGLPDAAVACQGSGNVSILLNSGGGAFAPKSDVKIGHDPALVAATDIDGDGKMDLVVVDGNLGAVYVLLGHGDGTFGAQLTYYLPTPFCAAPAPSGLAIADFSGDGRPDVAVSEGGSNDCDVLINNGDGTLAKAVTLAQGMSRVGVAAADFDGDGLADLALADGNNAFTAYLNISPVMGSWTLTPASVTTSQFSTGVVTLTKPAPSTGALVTLSASDPAVALVGPSVRILPGQQSVTIPVGAVGVGITNVAAAVNNHGASVAMTVTPAPAVEHPLTGDLNGDGIVDLADVELLLRVIGGLDSFSS